MCSKQGGFWKLIIDDVISDGTPDKNRAHFAIYEWASGFCNEGIVVDFGCELGVGTIPLVKKDRIIVGMDNNFAYLSHFNQHCIDAALKIVCCDGVGIPLETSSVNGICLINVIHLVKNPIIFLKECYRILNRTYPLILSIPIDINLPDFWRKPSEKEFLTSLIDKVFGESYFPDFLVIKNKKSERSLSFQNFEMGYLTAVCKKTKS